MASAQQATQQAMEKLGEQPAAMLHRLEHVLGGPARTKVIVLLGCVLGLETADLTAVGAAASELRSALHLTNTQLGVLAALPAAAAVIATLPIGVLADRVRRVRLLWIGIATWGVAMIFCGAAGSFQELVLVRLALGAVTAVAGPTLASLTGDYFRPSERSRVYGFILAGELVGSGFGLLVSGTLAGLISWRWAFWVLVVPALALAWFVRRLPEPARGGTSHLLPGAKELPGEGERPPERQKRPAGGEGLSANGAARRGGGGAGGPNHDPVMARAVHEQEIEPEPELVGRSDPEQVSLWRAIRYVLRVRTNVALIVSSALGYFFAAGVRTFGVLFVHVHYSVAQSLATAVLLVMSVGALAGTIGGGRLSDALIRRGHVAGRMLVGGWSYILACAILVPGVLLDQLVLAMPLLILASAAVAAPNPAVDAARLDVIHSSLWGRAEGVRTVLRSISIAIAPLLFGFVADQLGGSSPRLEAKGLGFQASSTGLQYTFLIMLVPMAIGGYVLLRARHRYPSEVASALEWERRTG